MSIIDEKLAARLARQQAKAEDAEQYAMAAEMLERSTSCRATPRDDKPSILDPKLAARLARQQAKAEDADQYAMAAETLQRSQSCRSTPREEKPMILDPKLAARLARQQAKAEDAEESAKAEESFQRAETMRHTTAHHKKEQSHEPVLDPALAARLARQADKAANYQAESAPHHSASHSVAGVETIVRASSAFMGVAHMKTQSSAPAVMDAKLAERLARQAGKADGTVEAASFEHAEKPREVDPNARRDRPSDELAARLNQQAKRATGQHQAGARMLFDQFDKDRSGSLEGGELQKLLQLLEISTEDCGRVMRALDRDGDGSLSFDEFYAWWELGLKVR